MEPFHAAILTFSLQSSAFFAEVFRGGVQSIEAGQWEAAKALGMNRREMLRRIILPQAVKRMIPAFLERSIELMKTTTLVSTIAYADLLYQANDIAQRTYRTIEVLSIAAMLYFIVIFACSIATRRVEKYLARSGETIVN